LRQQATAEATIGNNRGQTTIILDYSSRHFAATGRSTLFMEYFAFIRGLSPIYRSANANAAEQARGQREQSKEDKKRIRQLEKELHRKEKALAEAAALLVLRKKVQAIWGDKEED
jgi:hypothetical protein